MDEQIQDVQEVRPEDIFSLRLQKAEEWRSSGIEPYGEAFPDIESTQQVRGKFSPESTEEVKGRIAGRITAYRTMGKSIFADIRDSSGRL